MKNLLKFFAFVALLSLAISALYDYRLKHGGLSTLQRTTPEKYTLASSPNVDPKQVASLEALNRERRVLVSAVVPSVVAVKTTKKVAIERQNQLDPFGFFFRRPRGFQNPNDEALVQNSLGSGVIVTNEGHIITNNHVVVQAGDFVLAIGNPFGFDETVTDGIVSSKGRPNRADVFGGLIQTNAAINPGNSGGPLINLRGEVVGINTAIISRSGGSQGIGFAIPSNTVRTALESLLKKGRIIRGYLGIQMRVPQSGQPAPANEGVVVDEIVPGSPAEDARLQQGDVIRKFDGREVRSFADLRNLISQADLNKKVEVEIVRAGKPMTVATQIKEQPVGYQTGRVTPQQTPTRPTPGEENESGNALAGIDVGQLTPDLARQLDLPNGVHGVVVTAVDPDAGVADLQKGDVIEEVNQQAINSVADYNKIIQSLDTRQAQVLSVCRHRVRSFLVLRPR